MERKTITFSADQQALKKTSGESSFATNTVSYIDAVFTLGNNWQFDNVSAIWQMDGVDDIATKLDHNGMCEVPHEMVRKLGYVKVNLAGSITDGASVTERLTTYTTTALVMTGEAKVAGNETVPITPSQYEQFVANVKADADRAEAGATASANSADEAEASAQNASESASASAVSASESAQSATASAESAQNASEIAVEVEVMKNEVELAKDKVLGMRATAETLEAGSDATASYSDGLLTLGIPRGDQGIQGIQGETGATPNLTIGTVETLAPTEDATATITGTAENPVLNLGLPKGDTGEVSLEDLEALLPTDTASGDIVTIPDGQSVIPAESLKVALEPIQDLHGYDKPWSGGAGKNILNVGSRVSQTTAGVTYTSDDNYVILNGTKNGGGYADLSTLTLALDVGTYYAKAFEISGTQNPSTTAGLYVYDGSTNLTASSIIGTERQFTLSEAKTVRFRFGIFTDGVVYTNWKIGIVISKTSGIDAYEPYSNICPISGRTECDTHRTGVNVWDEEWEAGAIANSSGQNSSLADTVRSKGYIAIKPATQYYVKTPTTAYIRFYDADKTYLGSSTSIQNISSSAFTTPSNAYFMRFYAPISGSVYGNDISINYPSTDHDYHAYDGNTYTTDLGRTVYGGEVEVVGGALTDKMGMVDMGDLTWSYDTAWGHLPTFWARFDMKTVASGEVANVVCSQYATVSANALYAGADGSIANNGQYIRVTDTRFTDATAFASAVSGVQLCYELATPQTIQLTPQEVQLLLGTNNIWSDGKVTLTYSADIQRWVEKKLNGNSTTLTMSRPMTAELNETEETE